MDYWYVFKIKALFQIDVFGKKNEEEANKRANEIVDEFISGIGGLEVLECEVEGRGEIEDQTHEDGEVI